MLFPNSNYVFGDYMEGLRSIINFGQERENRTGTNTHSLFGLTMHYADVSAAFPLLPYKKMAWRWLVEETFWMLRGSVDVTELEERGVRWWTPWKREDGTVGPAYGAQMRELYTCRPPHRGGSGPRAVDPLMDLLRGIDKDPNSRRHIISLYNNHEVSEMTLPPCHGNIIHFNVDVENKELDLLMYQRSGDMLLGVPVNAAQYGLLLHLVAYYAGLKPRDFTHIVGDAHIYENHLDACEELLSRWDSKENHPSAPTVRIKNMNTSSPELFLLDTARSSPRHTNPVEPHVEFVELLDYKPLGPLGGDQKVAI